MSEPLEETILTETTPTEEERQEEVPESIPENDQHIPTIPQLCVALGILVFVFSTPYIAPLVHFTKKTVTPVAQKEPLLPSTISYRTDAFDSVDLQAQAAYVWDVSLQKPLFNKNAHAQLPLASLTKLMTALVAYDTYGDNAKVPITLSAIAQDGENGFTDGEVWRAKDLLDYTLITSSNDGAYALAGSAGAALHPESLTPEAAFVRGMNKKAEEIGLSQTYFTNPTGLDSSESQSGSYGSARDIAFLMEYIIKNKPELIAQTTRSSAEFSDAQGVRFSATNTNQEISSLDNALGSKTGYTDLAGGNLVVAYNIGLNHPIIISVLGSSREGRFSDVEKLVKRVQEAYLPQP